ncbi:RDD family protein [Streptomyces sp. NPDC092296]|uniref:RDD family protein n=1 Tax=Streptomyces sp. NPDC092296 TaxID=3366012 RepID=UPI0038250038
MTSQDPNRPDPGEQGDQPPSFDKPPPSAGPYGGPPYGTPPPPYGSGSPYDYPGGTPGGAPGGVPTGVPGEPIPGMPPLGGLGRRLLARIIDAVLIGALVSLVLGWFVNWNNRSGEATLSIVGGLVYWVYESLMLSRDGQTVGKKVTKVRVARLVDGGVPVGGIAWTRAAVYSLPSVLCCGFWVIIDGGWCLFDRPYRQCLHDKAARTVVVDARH